MQPSYQRSTRGARGRDLSHFVPFTFNNTQRGHKHCFADSTCSCRSLSVRLHMWWGGHSNSSWSSGLPQLNLREVLSRHPNAALQLVLRYTYYEIAWVLHPACLLGLRSDFRTLDFAGHRSTCDPAGSSNVTNFCHEKRCKWTPSFFSHSKPRCEERTVP
jgi:hypothetical protein